MLIVPPDFARRIDLPGTGPCPRPVDIDQTRTGFAKLVALRVYSFAGDMVVDGEAEGDEVFIVLLRGQADIGIDSSGNRVGEFSLRTDGGSRAVYLPPHAAYRLTALTDCDIAYARARPSGSPLRAACGFAPVANRLDISGHAAGMDLALATLPAGATLALVGGEGRSPERFVHVRCDGDGAATVSGARLGNWGSAILGDGEHATLAVERGNVDVLTVSASAH